MYLPKKCRIRLTFQPVEVVRARPARRVAAVDSGWNTISCLYEIRFVEGRMIQSCRFLCCGFGTGVALVAAGLTFPPQTRLYFITPSNTASLDVLVCPFGYSSIFLDILVWIFWIFTVFLDRFDSILVELTFKMRTLCEIKAFELFRFFQTLIHG